MVSRRDFLKITGTAATTAAAGLVCADTAQGAGHGKHLDPDRVGVLTDLTICIGCRRCEWACAEQNGLPHGDLSQCDDKSVFEHMRRPDAEAFTVVNRYDPLPGNQNPMNVKVQCMHCEDPACVSACIVGALEKDPRGPVTYNAWECIGCRYCMVACPFQIPAYEYHKKLTPQVMKCTLCFERTMVEGRRPACVEMCPPEALVYGKRSELLELARNRIRNDPDRYHNHIYGEHEVGGTSWLMIGDRPIEQLDLPVLPDQAPPEITETIQHGIFKGFTGPVMLFGLLSVLMKSAGDKRKEKEDDHV